MMHKLHADPGFIDRLASQYFQYYDRESFDYLIKHLYPFLNGLAAKFVQGRDARDDLVQETWIKALRHMNRLRDPRKIKSWLAQILVNEAYSSGRRKKPEVSFDEPANDAWLPAPGKRFELISREPSPFEQIAAREQLDRIEEALAGVEPSQRAAVILNLVEDLTMEEVAEILDISVAAAYKRVQRGRKSLAGLLSDLAA